MKKFKIIFMLLIITSSLLANDVKSKLSEEYLMISQTKGAIDSIIDAVVNQIIQSNPKENKEDLLILFNKAMGWVVLKEPMKDLISQKFTINELIFINNFYKTKIGKKYAKENLNISNELSGLVSNKMIQAMKSYKKKR